MWELWAKQMDDFITFLFWTALILGPLGLWKLIEIIVWLVKHVNITIS